MAPWADVLFAMDKAWWDYHHPINFEGERLSIMRNCPGARHIKLVGGGNSGTAAISLAEYRGAQRIILLGYDCKAAADGRRHWHGSHPRKLGNARSMPKWQSQFAQLAARLDNAEIVNATRDTALKHWPRMDLEEALNL